MNRQHAFALFRVIEKINVLIPAFEKSIPPLLQQTNKYVLF